MSDEVKLLPCEDAVVKLARNALRDKIFETADDNLHRAVESAIYRMHNSEVARCLLRIVATRPPIVTDEVVERVTPRFYVSPFRLIEPKGEEAATIVDAYGNAVAVMMWPCHLPEETEAAEQETYAVGRAFVAAIAAMPAVVQDGGE